jgi:hypothetical protein
MLARLVQQIRSPNSDRLVESLDPDLAGSLWVSWVTGSLGHRDKSLLSGHFFILQFIV